MKEEIKLNALNDEALDQVAGGAPRIEELTLLRWCDDCQKNVEFPLGGLFCPECGGCHISEPRT